MNPTFIGQNIQTGRGLALYCLRSVADVPDSFDTDGPYFVAMLVWDADGASNGEITTLARSLIDAGCAYLCCWGADCERVHDLFDDEWVTNGFEDKTDDTIMTTWHTDDTLDEFIWFSLLHTQPTQKYQNDCRTVIALVIDDGDRSSKIETAFADPFRFCDAHEADGNAG